MPLKKQMEGETPAARAEAFAALTGDWALVLDEKGQVLAVAPGAGPASPAAGSGRALLAWVGQDWQDLAAPDSRAKAGLLLAGALAQGPGQEVAQDPSPARRREINLRVPGGPPLALRCGAMRLGPGGPILVIGRDLGEHAALQQRLLAVQRELEGSYWETCSAQGTALNTGREKPRH